jgi:hypothetical protein
MTGPNPKPSILENERYGNEPSSAHQNAASDLFADVNDPGANVFPQAMTVGMTMLAGFLIAAAGVITTHPGLAVGGGAIFLFGILLYGWMLR